MSSASMSNLLETSDLTYRANNKDPRTDPWGTPLLTHSQDDNVPLTFTQWCLLIKTHGSELCGQVKQKRMQQNKWCDHYT